MRQKITNFRDQWLQHLFPYRDWAPHITTILMFVLYNIFLQHVIILQVKHIQNI